MRSRFRLHTFAMGIFCPLPILMLLAAQPCAASSPAAPPEFQDLVGSLNADLGAFNATLNSMWDGTKYPVLFAGTLKSADANGGPGMGDPAMYAGIDLQLQELKAMGVRAIMVAVGFPMLYEPFFESHAQYQQFVDLYTHVAASVRAAGLTLVVENNNLLSNDVQAGWNTWPFFSSLNWEQYQAARAQGAVAVAQAMHPDYMVVFEEPDMEASQTGQAQANTVDGSTSMLNRILTALQQSGITGVKIGAGVGTWHPQYLEFTQSFAAMPLDFIDMHIYPVNNSYLPNALTMAGVAASAGKPVAMTEAWMWKIRDSELNVLTPAEVRARNAYSFWAPEDAYALQTLQNIGYYTKMAFLAPSGPEYLFAYLNYDDVKTLPPGDVVSQEMAASSNANQHAAYTSTGLSFYHSLVSPPDSAPPSQPTGLSGVSGDPTQAAVTWTGSTDNVGAAGYYIFRDGVNIGSAGFTYYQDSGLTGSTTYTYTVAAFDLAGNVSTPSLPVSVTTRDVVAPTAPVGLVTTVVSCQQIKLSWSPSTDDVSVGSYRVFRGTSSSSLDQVGTTYGTTTTFTHYPLTPDTTYYFAVQAVDTSGNVSPMSPVVSAKTPALPSAPVNVTATPASPKQINVAWSPGPSGMPVGSYRISRGSSPSDLSQAAVRAASPYSDISLSPSTRYCYGIEEVDTGGNVSPMSAVVCAVTMSPPAAPANLTATPVSTKQINLAWSAAIPGGLPISRYNVFRGTSSSTLLKVGSTTKTAFSSIALTPSTTYYFAVQAVDTGNNLSPMSDTVPATTLALPSPPANVTAAAVSKTQVSLAWTAAESGMPLASYRLFRGMSSSALVQFGTVAATRTSATDYPVAAGTTYSYAVKTVDTGGNVSAFSNIAQVTTPK